MHWLLSGLLAQKLCFTLLSLCLPDHHSYSLLFSMGNFLNLDDNFHILLLLHTEQGFFLDIFYAYSVSGSPCYLSYCSLHGLPLPNMFDFSKRSTVVPQVAGNLDIILMNAPSHYVLNMLILFHFKFLGECGGMSSHIINCLNVLNNDTNVTSILLPTNSCLVAFWG